VYDFMVFKTLAEEEDERSLRTDMETDDPLLLRCRALPKALAEPLPSPTNGPAPGPIKASLQPPE